MLKDHFNNIPLLNVKIHHDVLGNFAIIFGVLKIYHFVYRTIIFNNESINEINSNSTNQYISIENFESHYSSLTPGHFSIF